jgi:hypothetical protein
MMAGTSPPLLSKSISTVSSPEYYGPENKKARWSLLRQRAKRVLCLANRYAHLSRRGVLP